MLPVPSTLQVKIYDHTVQIYDLALFMMLLPIQKAKLYFNSANLPIWPKDGDTCQKMIVLPVPSTLQLKIYDHTLHIYDLALFPVLLPATKMVIPARK